MASINEILDRIRKGEIKGKVEFEVDDKGMIKKITVEPKDSHKEISESIEKVNASAQELSGADFSRTRLSGNLSGMDLRGSDFSYARIEGMNMSGANLDRAVFQKAVVTQTDMKNAYSADMRGAYLTGSVDLYGIRDAPALLDIYQQEQDVPKSYHRYDQDRMFFGKDAPGKYGDY